MYDRAIVTLIKADGSREAVPAHVSSGDGKHCIARIDFDRAVNVTNDQRIEVVVEISADLANAMGITTSGHGPVSIGYVPS